MYVNKGGWVNKWCRFLGVTCIGFFTRWLEDPMNSLLPPPPLSNFFLFLSLELGGLSVPAMQ